MGGKGRPGGAAAGLTGAARTARDTRPTAAVQAGRDTTLTGAVQADYDAAAAGWADGPGQMYAVLARELVAAAPVPLAGRRVLNLRAGAVTGADPLTVSVAILTAG
ncbi:MAG: hypothetical protein JO132_04250 [Streptosporangiaceae bacterium]|nr:hypothetical protein [Streptosporangiaceae bacterium]